MNTDTHFLQILVPCDSREEVLAQLHDHLTAGHLGTTKTIDKMKKGFYWYKNKDDDDDDELEFNDASTLLGH